MDILGVRIDNFSKEEILEKIEKFLSEDKFHQIATVNAEFILRAQEDEDFKNILNECDLNIADSISIKYAFLRFGKILKARIAGIDLMHEILKIADEKKMSVFLAASKTGLSNWEETRDALSKIYPNVRFSGGNIDPMITDHRLPMTDCRVIFCNFGAPEQERFIKSVKDDIMGLAMGVGGSFDFVTGKAKRAPIWMRYFGLEWLWRFIQEPRYRLKRIFNAVIIFPIKVLFSNNKH